MAAGGKVGQVQASSDFIALQQSFTGGSATFLTKYFLCSPCAAVAFVSAPQWLGVPFPTRYRSRYPRHCEAEETRGVVAGRGNREKDVFEMPSGTVKWFNATKGYGFIQPDNGGKDVFVHVTALESSGMKSLNEGQRVNFEVMSDRRGEKATTLTLAD